MNINIPQQYFSKLMRAVVEFNLIENNDHILIGLSGGKDSLFLTYALAILRERLPKKFTLSAVTIDPMFTDNFAADSLTKFCRNLGIEHSVHKDDINGTIKSSSDEIANGIGAPLRAREMLLFLPSTVGLSYHAPITGGSIKLATVEMFSFKSSISLLIPKKSRLKVSPYVPTLSCPIQFPNIPPE